MKWTPNILISVIAPISYKYHVLIKNEPIVNEDQYKVQYNLIAYNMYKMMYMCKIYDLLLDLTKRTNAFILKV